MIRTFKTIAQKLCGNRKSQDIESFSCIANLKQLLQSSYNEIGPLRNDGAPTEHIHRSAISLERTPPTLLW